MLPIGLVVSGGDHSLYTTVDEALGYLDARTEFWETAEAYVC